MTAHMRTLAKPRYSAMSKARKNLKRAIVRGAKDAAKERDGYRCRRCGSPDRPEAAHIVDSGMGGRMSVSSHRRDYVTLCGLECHRGRRSVHSGHIRIVAGPDGGDGAVTFEETGAFTYSDHYVKPVRMVRI